MSYQGAQGGKLIFSGGINHPIPITIPNKHFGARKRSHRKRRSRKSKRSKRSKTKRKLRRSRKHT